MEASSTPDAGAWPVPAGTLEQRPADGGDDAPTLEIRGEPRQLRRTLMLSLAAHAMLIGVALVAPLLLPVALPERTGQVRALVYLPPPPPPPPLPRGSALLPDVEPARPATAEERHESTLVLPDLEPPTETMNTVEEPGIAEAQQWGSPEGSPFGVPEGMAGGVEGGVAGGVLGGVLGGVVGGFPGGELVLDYDRPPRLLRQVQPVYPQEAFTKKVEGTVVVEIAISPAGRVAAARVVKSVPLLDEAALEAVRQWVFSPAYRHGRPVATLAEAPVTFRIY